MTKIPSNLNISSKRLKIDKSNTKVLIYTSIAVVVLIFSLVAAQALWKQIQYQNKVLSLREKAADQLEKNKKATVQLQAQFVAFDTATESIIANSDPNSKVVLNALPSKYDFPALATSMEALMNQSGVTIVGISGTDDQASAQQSSSEPAPTEIPFSVTANGSYESIKKLISNIEKSTRPIKVNSIKYSGTESDLQVQINAVTYYQPLKTLDLNKKQVPQNGSKVSKTNNNKKAAQ
jgi:Tfp pilus assembly protein PilO